MPWLEERTLILFVRDTQIRRYEPGVREGRVHVEGGSCSSGTSGTRRALPLEGGRHGIVHSHRLVRQHDATHYTSLKQHSGSLSGVFSTGTYHCLLLFLPSLKCFVRALQTAHEIYILWRIYKKLIIILNFWFSCFYNCISIRSSFFTWSFSIHILIKHISHCYEFQKWSFTKIIIYPYISQNSLPYTKNYFQFVQDLMTVNRLLI